MKTIETIGFTRWLFIALLVFFCADISGGALIPPMWTDAVVALGSMQLRVVPGQPCTVQWFTEGTGFLYGFLTQNDPDPSKRLYEVYLVTNRHVIDEHVAGQLAAKAQHGQVIPGCPAPPPVDEASISIRLNPLKSSSEGRQFSVPIKDWFFHPNSDVDVAAVLLDGRLLKSEGLIDVLFTNDVMAANKEKLKSLGVSAGDGVFVLGFPMNLAGAQRNYVIVRQGCIARISDMLDGSSPNYLLDAFIFPGNSGGPVILKPEITSISGTPAQATTYLIGFVSSYQPYIDVGVSPQTKRARITFEENSGLAEILPTDIIEEAIIAHRATLPKP
jgi:hypothetical protein